MLAPFVVVRELIEELLHLIGGPMLADDLPFFGRENIICRSHVRGAMGMSASILVRRFSQWAGDFKCRRLHPFKVQVLPSFSISAKLTTIGGIYKKLLDAQNDSRAYPHVRKKEDRLAYLEKCMDNLIKAYMVIPKIEDSYELIDRYVEIQDKEEREYCKKYLLREYKRRSFRRYDY